jgi:PIN domain nuclease of toxin-antitoxin system
VDLLLDTHVLLWWLTDDGRLQERQRAMLHDAGTRLLVSSVSAFEIATKVRIGKLPAASVFERELERICTDLDLHELSLSIEHAALAGRLSAEHRDPFDRLLAAQSIVERIALMTNDAAFRTFPVDVAW